MAYNVGNIIKERREELNISQASICCGICSNATLSRIESGVCIPNRQIMTQLLERLGYSKIEIDAISSKSEYETISTIAEIKRLFCSGRVEKAFSLLDRLLINYDSLDPHSRRFCDTMNTIQLLKNKTIDSNQTLLNLEKILRETCPSYSTNSLPKVMTFDEIFLLHNIAIQYASLGKTDTAIKILYHIKDYQERFIEDETESCRSLPAILYDLSNYLGLEGKYDECIEICEYSIDKQIRSGRCLLLAETYYNLARALIKRGRESDMECAKEALLNAYYTSEVFAKSQELTNLIKELYNEIFKDGSF